jgi:hypothetical protein
MNHAHYQCASTMRINHAHQSCASIMRIPYAHEPCAWLSRGLQKGLSMCERAHPGERQWPPGDIGEAGLST